MESGFPHIRWINSQYNEMITLLEDWASVNSGSENLEGLAKMQEKLKMAFLNLTEMIQTIPLPPYKRINSKGSVEEAQAGNALLIKKHPDAPIKLLLSGHYDTVFPQNSPFQKVKFIDNNTLNGPGVADMKGGLVVMLKALEALEQSPVAGKIGWEVLLNPDEEVGSMSSHHLLTQCAKRTHLGLIFEPSFPDGSLVSSRKGSVNYTIVAKGRAAHAGRDFHLGHNAISAMARFLLSAEALTDQQKGITVNIGHIEGGGPTNIVPDLAICRLNIRVVEQTDLVEVQNRLNDIVNAASEENIVLTLHKQSERPPKLFDTKHQGIFGAIRECGEELNLGVKWNPTGGVCDGNILAAEGLPTIDTLGVVGGNIHTDAEYVLLNSLTQRAALVAHFLVNIGSEKITLPAKEKHS